MSDFVLIGVRGAPENWAALLPESSVLRAPPGESLLLCEDSVGRDYCARFEVRGGRVMLCDLDSRDAMRVNGHTVDYATLRAGDVVQIGEVAVRLEQVDELAAEASVDSSSPHGDIDDDMDLTARMATTPAASPPRGPRLGAIPMGRPPVVVERSCARCGSVAMGPEATSDAGWVCRTCIDAPRNLKPQDPQSIGSFEVLGFLARGGMGLVYEGAGRLTGLHVAIKLLALDREMPLAHVKRFAREQQISEALHHPNVIRCVEVGRHEGRLYIASEFVSGGNAVSLAGPQSPIAQVLRVAADLFRAIGYGHSRGVVHRDIKPGNVLLTPPGPDGLSRALLADYGLAKNFDDESASAITAMGDTGGSMAMMSPEQLLDFKSAGPTADLYSAAACVYRLFTGDTHLFLSIPMAKATLAQVASAIGDPRRIPLAQRRADVPAEVAAWIDRLLARDVSARASLTADHIADVFEQSLREYAESKMPPSQ